MNIAKAYRTIIISISIAILSSCTPSIFIQPTENLDAGQVKRIKAEVKAACGYTAVHAQYKKSTATSWIALAPRTASGDTYSSEIIGSQNFAEGDTYDFRWAVDYNKKRKSIFNSNCESISPATVTSDSYFTVPVCVPNSLSVLPVTKFGQRTDKWCWATSGQMIMNYLGTNVAQCTQANYRFGRTDCCDDGGGICGSLSDVVRYLAYHAPCIRPEWPSFSHFGFDASILYGALSWNDLKQQLSDAPHCKRAPVAFTWEWTGGGAHMMVARGYGSVDLPIIGHRDFVAIHDPWPPCHGDSKLVTYGEYVERKGDHTHSLDYYNIRRRP